MMRADEGALSLAQGGGCQFASSASELGADAPPVWYRRLLVLLRREGFIVNHKRLFRPYREEPLMVRRRGGRKRTLGTRAPMTIQQLAK
jgi:hypothetical protein